MTYVERLEEIERRLRRTRRKLHARYFREACETSERLTAENEVLQTQLKELTARVAELESDSARYQRWYEQLRDERRKERRGGETVEDTSPQ